MKDGFPQLCRPVTIPRSVDTSRPTHPYDQQIPAARNVGSVEVEKGPCLKHHVFLPVAEPEDRSRAIDGAVLSEAERL